MCVGTWLKCSAEFPPVHSARVPRWVEPRTTATGEEGRQKKSQELARPGLAVACVPKSATQSPPPTRRHWSVQLSIRLLGYLHTVRLALHVLCKPDGRLLACEPFVRCPLHRSHFNTSTSIIGHLDTDYLSIWKNVACKFAALQAWTFSVMSTTISICSSPPIRHAFE